MLVFFTQGVGMFFGYWIAGLRFASTMTSQGALEAAIKEARPESQLSFLQTFSKMFSQTMPEGVDPALVSETMAQWKEFWLLPAGMAAGIFVLFALLFHEKKEVEQRAIDAATEAVPAAEAPA